ncbi:UDP-glucose 4-epimerase GalE [Dyella solisilvae]|uniref:UDP-glucose 4-epimerase n=1 Tax=Dyella solisilvae TaxID=1920168 RepID=A0A370KDH0_9GAMM|nr:UDP-glucose 4-epimerase GalE [Dyella solisilvae]RDJ00705.1 UDP-glucose 4-epimerase GalE [Dyella solisilvae]
MKILVCGGAGYIGSHMVRYLGGRGHEVIVLDNLSTGHREAVDERQLEVADLLVPSSLKAVFSRHSFDGVIHFCARSLVGESVSQPYAYYENNVAGTLNLLQAMREAGVSKLVFSSTAAVFGHPETTLIAEDHPTRPINPYGASKLMVERILADAASAYGLRSTALRYFNAAGAHPEGRIGESHQPETHLIPNVLRAALGQEAGLKVFGLDYPTRDGTCVRDYVHVNDLASAHLLALQHMESYEGAHLFNLGNGQGFTVLEVIEAARHVTGRSISYAQGNRRPGDPAVLVASSDKAQRVLGWRPRFTDIGEIIETAWRWHQAPRY